MRIKLRLPNRFGEKSIKREHVYKSVQYCNTVATTKDEIIKCIMQELEEEELMKRERVFRAVRYCETKTINREELIECVMQQTGFTREEVEHFMELV